MSSRLLPLLVALGALGVVQSVVTPDGLLIQHLMSSYDARARPHYPSAVNVSIGLAVKNIQDINQLKGIVSSNIWLRLYWNDPNLAWNTSAWNGVSHIAMPTTGVNTIWVPDMMLYNTGENPFKSLYPAMANVYPDGSVQWSRPGIIQGSYAPDLEKFPFDKERIFYQFGSWAYDAGALDLMVHSSGLDTSVFVPPTEWKFDRDDTVLNSVLYNCCPNPYKDATFSIYMTRNSMYYVGQAIIPGLIFAVAAWGSFFMSRFEGIPARTAVLMTGLLSQVTLRVVVGNKIPVMEKSCWLETYQLYLLIFNACALFEFIIVQFLCTGWLKTMWWEPASIHSWKLPCLTARRNWAYADIRDRLERLEAGEDLEPLMNEKVTLIEKPAAVQLPVAVAQAGVERAPEPAAENNQLHAHDNTLHDRDAVLLNAGISSPAPGAIVVPLNHASSTENTQYVATENVVRKEATSNVFDFGFGCLNPSASGSGKGSGAGIETEMMPTPDADAAAALKLNKMKAGIQADLRGRKVAFGLHDGPGPQLAMRLDQFMRVVYIGGLIAMNVIKLREVDQL